MKSKFTVLYGLFFLTFFLVSNSANPPDGNTGAPSDGKCSSCHIGNNMNNFEGSIDIQGIPEIMEPNATYPIKIVATKLGGNPIRAGFQMVVLDNANETAGILSDPGENAVLTMNDGRTYFEHNPAQRFDGTDEVSWTVNWTTPTTINTEAQFYISAIFGDGSGSGGDLSIESKITRSIQNAAAPIQASITNLTNVTCFGDSDGGASVSISEGVAPYSYAWSNGNTTPSVNNLMAGNHEVTITDAAETSTVLQFTITEPAALAIEVLNQTNIDCRNSIGLVMVEATGGTPTYQYAWEDIEGSAVSLPTGTHTVTVTDASGCIETADIIIDKTVVLPQVNAGPSRILDCNRDIIDLEGKGDEGADVTYLWTTNTGSIILGETSLTPIVESKGIYTLLVTNTTTGCSASSQVEVTENIKEPVISAGNTKTLNCSDANIALEGSVIEGNLLSYQWSSDNGSNIEDANSLTPKVSQIGVYTLVATDGNNGCTRSASVSVIPDISTPMANAGVSQAIDCATNELVLNGEGSTGIDFIYLWETEDGKIERNETSLTPTVSRAGTYTLVVRNRVNGCDASSSVVVTGDDPVIANAGGDISLSCSSATVTSLNGNTSSSGNNITYEWSTVDGNIVSDPTASIINIDEAGTYSLAVKNTITGCISTDQVVVNEADQMPDLSVTDTLVLTCEMPSVRLEATVTAGPGLLYQWISDNGNIISDAASLNPLVNAPGVYNIGVINTMNGCVATASVEVLSNADLPIAQIMPPSQELGCTATSIVLDASNSSIGAGLVYEWSTEDGRVVSGASTLTPSVDQAGTYTLLISDGPCKNTASIRVEENPFSSSIVFETPPELNCNNSLVRLSVALDNATNAIYEWSTNNGNIVAGGNTSAPLVDEPGEYVVAVQIDGCEKMDVISVIEDTDALDVQIETPTVLDCNNAVVELNVLGNNAQTDFIWSTTDGNITSGELSDRARVDAPGIYEVLVTNTTNGCSGRKTIEVEERLLAIALDTTIANAATVIVEGGVAPYTYAWNSDPVQISVTANNLTPGTYEVTVTDASGCSITANLTIGDMSTSVATISTLTSFDLYPNPTKETFRIQAAFNQTETGQVVIGNVLGATVWQQAFDTRTIALDIDVHAWPAGVYFMQLVTKEGIKMEEVVVGK